MCDGLSFLNDRKKANRFCPDGRFLHTRQFSEFHTKKKTSDPKQALQDILKFEMPLQFFLRIGVLALS